MLSSLFEFIPYQSLICQSNLHLRSAMKNISTPLDGAYLADFGIDLSLEEEPSLRGNSLWPERTIYHRRFTVNCATICDFEQKIEDE